MAPLVPIFRAPDAVPRIVLTSPAVSNNQVRLNFTVISTQTNGALKLLQSDHLNSAWITNTAATLTTNMDGLSYQFTTTANGAARFYRVQLN